MKIENISTTNLILRPFTLNDVNSIFKLSREKSLRKWIPDQVYKDENEARDVIEFLMAQYQMPIEPNKRPYVLAIEFKTNHEVIGHIGLSPKDDEIEIGYAIGENFMGKGFATEAVTAVANWALSALPISGILGIVADENAGSGKVLEKAGFNLIYEGEMLYLGKARKCSKYLRGKSA